MGRLFVSVLSRALLQAAHFWAFFSLLTLGAQAQEVLPEIVVQAQRPAPPRPKTTPKEPKSDLASKNTKFDESRDNLSPRFGASSFDLNRAAIETLPQGLDTPIDKVLLQAPGVSQDSAVAGDIHVRNEHANVQYRINGITLPDGLSGFGHVLDTGFIGSVAVITGALPAEYGLRTAGVVDIQTKSGNSLVQGGQVGIYGGSNQTFTPSFDYSGRSGSTEYFFSGSGFTSSEGIENPTPNTSAIHDRTYQGNFFSYTSTVIDDHTRVATIFGNTTNYYQIPNNPGQSFAPGVTSAYGISSFDSANLNERQREQNDFAVLALQKTVNEFDFQLASFTRYSTLHFIPDTIGDLLFNGQATDVFRQSVASGIQGDGSYRLNDAHTLRAGFTVSGEQTKVSNTSTVFPADLFGNAIDTPYTIDDGSSKLGWIAGLYVQDEWRITDKLTLNTGLRFDQMWQYVDANQLSPRVNLVYKPFAGTTFHAGYARYFTPPQQALAGPVNVAAFAGTYGAPTVTQQDPVLPERSNYFDAGVVQTVMPGLQVGVDGYYKIAKDLIDDGTFGPGLVLDQFNYAKGKNAGVEFTTTYTAGNFKAYGNLAWAKQRATDIVSNQYLIDSGELAYIASHWIYTDHAQTLTGSAGVSYLWDDTRYSADLIYGSGLRSGDDNTSHVPGYTQVNIGASREFMVPNYGKFTARFAVVNVFDSVYLIRDGSGVGVFAPQYGPRRGYFFGLSKAL
jgi:outer membrane receptor protein involved in Fe transport